jgi:hypothetical protein
VAALGIPGLDAVDNIFAFLAFLVVIAFLVIQWRRSNESKRETPLATIPMMSVVEPTPTNGNGKYATRDWVEALMGKHEIHCGNAEQIMKRLDRMEDKLDKVLEDRR